MNDYFHLLHTLLFFRSPLTQFFVFSLRYVQPTITCVQNKLEILCAYMYVNVGAVCAYIMKSLSLFLPSIYYGCTLGWSKKTNLHSEFYVHQSISNRFTNDYYDKKNRWFKKNSLTNPTDLKLMFYL